MNKANHVLICVGVVAMAYAPPNSRADVVFGPRVNLGDNVNRVAVSDGFPCISHDGVTLYYTSFMLTGHDGGDIWTTTRVTNVDEWGQAWPIEGPVNTSSYDGQPCISTDGLTLYFSSKRSTPIWAASACPLWSMG